MGRFLNADTLFATGQGFVGNNMFAYCLNNPIIYKDANGKDPTAIAVFTAALIIAVGVSHALYYAGNAIWQLGSWIANSIQTVSSAISFSKKASEPEIDPPDVTYPGDDPAEAPDGYEWRGPDEQGGKRGGYANPNGKDSWHPDLDHPDGIDPHWDYNDSFNRKWRVFPNRIELTK